MGQLERDSNGLLGAPLGEQSAYPQQYDPTLLFALPRQVKRQEIGLPVSLPFVGADFWTAYELSWLNAKGKPQVAIAYLTIPCETPNIVESKSLKLYFNGFNQTKFENAQAVQTVIANDLSQAVWGGESRSTVGVRLVSPENFEAEQMQVLTGVNLDRLDIDCESDLSPDPNLLKTAAGEQAVSETLVSHLLKSNCLVTGQPDWGSLIIRYTGDQIDQAGLLRYIIGFRQHNEFHEQCVERIYWDLWQRCKPSRLMVYARYTRRGGIDINPWRTSHPSAPPSLARTARQ